MGNCHNKKIYNELSVSINTINTIKVNGLVIKCDKNGIIFDVSDYFLTISGYKIDELKNKFIGIIMSPFLSYIHSHFILPKYSKLNHIEKKSVDVFISGLEYKRPMIIFGKNKNILYVNISIKICTETNCDFIVDFELIKKLDNSLIYTHELKKNNQLTAKKKLDNSLMYVEDSSNLSTDFKLTQNKIVVVCIDFKNSTQFLVSKGPLETINCYKNFHKDVVRLLKKDYYPYIYIHEIIGDCFVIVSNIDWALTIPKFCTSIVMSFLMELYKITNHYIQIRIGVSYEKLYWGYIDNNLRLFGIPMNLASRLENICVQDSLLCDDNFLNKLIDEKLFDTTNIIYTRNKAELKGLGECNYNIIPFDSKNNLDIFNMKQIH